jgi:hypothetical protein
MFKGFRPAIQNSRPAGLQIKTMDAHKMRTTPHSPILSSKPRQSRNHFFCGEQVVQRRLGL